jgi:hypothetical protein
LASRSLSAPAVLGDVRVGGGAHSLALRPPLGVRTRRFSVTLLRRLGFFPRRGFERDDAHASGALERRQVLPALAPSVLARAAPGLGRRGAARGALEIDRLLHDVQERAAGAKLLHQHGAPVFQNQVCERHHGLVRRERGHGRLAQQSAERVQARQTKRRARARFRFRLRLR